MFSNLARSDASWICCNCGIPNFSSSLFRSLDIDCENSFDPLNEPSLNASITSNRTDPGSPIHSSSPKQPSNKTRQRGKSVRVLVVNCQSIMAKKESFWETIDTSSPDIICANETWLSQKVLNSEFIQDFEVYRKDRATGYGGVLIAVKKDIISQELATDSPCEIVCCKIELFKTKPLIICSVYRPPSSDIDYSINLCNSLRDIAKYNPNSTIWVAGDLNLPDINWEQDTVVNHQYPIALNECYLSCFNDVGIEQMVNFPTRGENILDLFLSNRPSLVNRAECLPGISDHDMVLIDSSITAKRNKPVKREIKLWKKANQDGLITALSSFKTQFIEMYSIDTPIEELWSSFKDNLTSIIDKYVPKKTTSSRHSEPWITREIKSLSRRKQRAYKRSKNSRKYKYLKQLAQRKKREAYNKYVNDIFCDEFKANPKKFWTFIKSKKCETSGIAPLKHNGITHINPKAKANILNNQFTSVFTKDDSTELPAMGPSPHPDVPVLHIQENGVEKLMKNLNPYKASGPDDLPARVLKDYCTILSAPLCLIFNASVQQGKLPNDWRKALISPLF